MGQSSSSNSNVLTLFKVFVLCVVSLSVPDLATFVDDTHFTLVVVYFEKLQHFDLKIEVVKFTFSSLGPYFWYITKLGYVLFGENIRSCKLFSRPDPQTLDDLFIFWLDVHRFAVESYGNEVITRGFLLYHVAVGVLLLKVRCEESPRAVEAYVYCQLQLVFKDPYRSSVNANDLAYSLRDW